MNKERAIDLAYQIATMTRPGSDVLELLSPLPYERVMELLLILRMSPKRVNSPLNFLRRAIIENWTPETLPEPINRKTQNDYIVHLMARGISREQAESRYHEWRTGK